MQWNKTTPSPAAFRTHSRTTPSTKSHAAMRMALIQTKELSAPTTLVKMASFCVTKKRSPKANTALSTRPTITIQAVKWLGVPTSSSAKLTLKRSANCWKPSSRLRRLNPTSFYCKLFTLKPDQLER